MRIVADVPAEAVGALIPCCSNFSRTKVLVVFVRSRGTGIRCSTSSNNSSSRSIITSNGNVSSVVSVVIAVLVVLVVLVVVALVSLVVVNKQDIYIHCNKRIVCKF